MEKFKALAFEKPFLVTGVIIFTMVIIAGGIMLLRNSTNNKTSSSPTVSDQLTPSKPKMQTIYESAISKFGFSSSQHQIDGTDGGMAKLSDDGSVIIVRMPVETDAHTTDWGNILVRIVGGFNGLTNASEYVQIMQDAATRHMLDYQEVQDTDDMISEFLSNIKLTDDVNAVIGIANDQYPFLYFAFYEPSMDLLTLTNNVCTGFYTKSLFMTDVSLFAKDASERYYDAVARNKIFSFPTNKMAFTGGVLSVQGTNINQNSMLRGGAIVDNLSSCVFATMSIPSVVIQRMTEDRKANWKSDIYTWEDYQVKVEYDSSNTPYFSFSRKNNNGNSDEDDNSEITVTSNVPSASISPIIRNGTEATQITIPVSCSWDPNDYYVNTTGYLRTSDGDSTRTDATMFSSNKYAKYGAVTCATAETIVNYSIPNGYKIRSNLGGTYRASRDEEKRTITIHVEMNIFADGTEAFYSSRDADGYQFYVFDESGKTVKTYFVKLVPTFSTEQNAFLNNWRSKLK